MDVETRIAIANDLERLVGPGAGDHMYGPYEAASEFDRGLALWAPAIQSADAEMLPHKGTLDARVRDQTRNDGYTQTGQHLHKDGVVGSMFMLNVQPELRVLKSRLKTFDEAWAEEFQQEVEAKFLMAAESTSKWMDASGANTFTEQIRLAVGVFLMSGEYLATSEWLRDSGRPFQTAFQAIDVDRLSTPYEQMGDQRVRAGVRQNFYGRPLGYYIRRAHPSDHDRYLESMEHKYVPAQKPWGRKLVIHVREQMRPDQTRGVSELVAGLKAARISTKFRDVTLQNAVVNAMYAASIESELPSEAVFAAMGAGNMPGDPGRAAVDYAGKYLAAVSAYAGSAKNMQVDGVKIPHFFPGTRLQLRPMGNPGGVGQDFEVSLLRNLSSTLGVSYEELSHDYSRTNYSSARAAFLQTWRRMQSRKKILADYTATVMFQNWFEEQLNTGQIDSLPAGAAEAANFYDGLNKEAYTNCVWIGASRGQIDELKETQAAVLRIKYGLSTHEDELAKLGKDWRRTYEQLEREKTERKKRGIELQEDDNMMNAASGTPRESRSDGEADEGERDAA